MIVNTVVGLTFRITLADYVDQNDEFQITFPSGLSVSFANVTGTGSFSSGSISGQVLTITQKTFVTRLYSVSQVFTINFYNFTAPTSVKETDPI